MLLVLYLKQIIIYLNMYPYHGPFEFDLLSFVPLIVIFDSFAFGGLLDLINGVFLINFITSMLYKSLCISRSIPSSDIRFVY